MQSIRTHVGTKSFSRACAHSKKRDALHVTWAMADSRSLPVPPTSIRPDLPAIGMRRD